MATKGDVSLQLSDTFYEFYCTLCEKKGIHAKANKRCKECGENLCGNCITNHNMFQAMREHTLVDKQDMVNPRQDGGRPDMPSVECKTHPGNKIELYCRDHDAVSCVSCRKIDHRGNLGNDRYVEVTRWKGEQRVDLREWRDGIPTKKGISLTLMRWKNWIDAIEYLEQALTNKDAYNSHIGGNVYCTVSKGSRCVDLRQYWKPQDDIVPTKRGLCLRPDEYNLLKELVPKINETVPEIDAVVPCYLQSDHLNQIGALQCPECNPNDCENW